MEKELPLPQPCLSPGNLSQLTSPDVTGMASSGGGELAAPPPSVSSFDPHWNQPGLWDGDGGQGPG